MGEEIRVTRETRARKDGDGYCSMSESSNLDQCSPHPPSAPPIVGAQHAAVRNTRINPLSLHDHHLAEVFGTAVEVDKLIERPRRIVARVGGNVIRKGVGVEARMTGDLDYDMGERLASAGQEGHSAFVLLPVVSKVKLLGTAAELTKHWRIFLSISLSSLPSHWTRKERPSKRPASSSLSSGIKIGVVGDGGGEEGGEGGKIDMMLSIAEATCCKRKESIAVYTLGLRCVRRGSWR